ncbi:hypothetical protein MICRO8M_30151 [Microbacterium sp. 8M]|nr:hypothetical protein MICRO8M_30151 [Microbacterium sp. 8M]
MAFSRHGSCAVRDRTFTFSGDSVPLHRGFTVILSLVRLTGA